MNKNCKISIILPVFNEEKNIPLIAEKYSALNKNTPIELIFVEDGGSTDNTRKALAEAERKYKFVKKQFIKEKGYGISIYEGLKVAKSDFICWTHADMQTDPSDTIKAYELIKKQNDPKRCLIKGKRKERPLFDAIFAFGMSVFESVLFWKIMHDINAQPNLFHRSLLEKIKNPPKDFSFDLYIYHLAKKHKYKIIRFPVFFPKRIHGESSWNTGIKNKMKFIKRTIKYSIELKFR